MNALRIWRTILVATGIQASLVPLGLALALTLGWHNGMIEAIGPLTLAVPLPVVVAAPALTAIACGISHVPVRTPVITRCLRTFVARLVSHTTVCGAGLGIIALGELTGSGGMWGAALRNLLFLGASALVIAGLAGPTYAWAPVLIIFGAAALSNPDDSSWSLYALVMAPTATPAQLTVTAAAFAGALVFAALDPFCQAYLPTARRGLARA